MSYYPVVLWKTGVWGLAFEDQSKLETYLDGSGSDDPDGTIVSYEWKEGDLTLGTGLSFTYPFTLGTHTVTLLVTDDAGATATDTMAVTVQEQVSQIMHVENINMWYTRTGRNYNVYTEVIVVDSGGAPVTGATVTIDVRYPDGSHRTYSGTTDAGGSVVLKAGSTKRTGTFTSTVTDVSLGGWSYDPAANIETSESLVVP